MPYQVAIASQGMKYVRLKVDGRPMAPGTVNSCAPVAGLAESGACSVAADYALLTPPLPTGLEVRPAIDICAAAPLAEAGYCRPGESGSMPIWHPLVKCADYTHRVAPDLLRMQCCGQTPAEVQNHESAAALAPKGVKLGLSLAEQHKVEIPFNMMAPWDKKCAGTGMVAEFATSPRIANLQEVKGQYNTAEMGYPADTVLAGACCALPCGQ